MDKSKKDLLCEAQDGLEIQSVDLRSSSVMTDHSFSRQTVHQFDELVVQSRKDLLLVKYFNDMNDESEMVAIEYSLGTRLVQGQEDSKDDPEVMMEVESVLAATYSINRENEPSREAVQVFAEENGLFHVWPYWRELVQSSCSRVGVPVMPVEMRPGKVEISEGMRNVKLELPVKD